MSAKKRKARTTGSSLMARNRVKSAGYIDRINQYIVDLLRSAERPLSAREIDFRLRMEHQEVSPSIVLLKKEKVIRVHHKGVDRATKHSVEYYCMFDVPFSEEAVALCEAAEPPPAPVKPYGAKTWKDAILLHIEKYPECSRRHMTKVGGIPNTHLGGLKKMRDDGLIEYIMGPCPENPQQDDVELWRIRQMPAPPPVQARMEI